MSFQHLREAVDRAVVEADALPAPADGQQPQPALLRRGDHLVGMLVIGDDHGGAARLHQIAEQPQLGGEISFERRMIIEMIAADIGECAGGDAHAVEPKLIETVRGRLQYQMRDVVAGELVERAMQFDRIGRGQRAVDLASGRNEPDGADAGRRLASRFPDLARERRDRGLAAGTGNGRDGVGLVLEQARGGNGERAARIADAHEGDAVGQRHRRHLLRHDRDRAGIDGVLHEFETVVLGAGHGDEQAFRLHLAAVGGDGAHVEIGEPRVAEGIDGEELGEFHVFRPVAARLYRTSCPAIARQRRA